MSKVDNYLKVIRELENVVGYVFHDKKLPFEALSHSSFANEFSQKNNYHYRSNERMEFLGDSVLSVIISEELYRYYSDLTEGELSKMRASIVCEASLAECAKKVNLDSLILLGSGENINGGRQRASILADCYEAVIGAIYLDGGLDAAKEFVLRIMDDLIKRSVNNIDSFDYKTTLQEMLQKGNYKMPTYQVIKVEGPDHNRTFTTKVSISENMYGIGVGRSKKEAEQNAAKDFIDKDYLN